ncbi:MAG TPA: hypothetical protein VM871_05135, partial [Flavisolibacter sp.]|nr:hypothetical protein [Flavisolibacter sp.]
VQANDPEGSAFEIFFNNSSCILPVTLSTFTAVASAAGTQLSWAATAQNNVNKYELERSTDGLNFSTITQVPANSTAIYRYTDVAPVAGTTYYRLKIIDANGSFSYSFVVKAVQSRTTPILIQFNQGADVLAVSGLGRGNIITVYTLIVTQVAEVHTGQSTERISTVNWPTGLYVVRILNKGNIVATEKFFKH